MSIPNDRHELPKKPAERGTALVELLLFTLLLAAFCAGMARTSASFRERFRRIVDERNRAIAAARGQAPELLPAGLLRPPADVGGGGPPRR